MISAIKSNRREWNPSYSAAFWGTQPALIMTICRYLLGCSWHWPVSNGYFQQVTIKHDDRSNTPWCDDMLDSSDMTKLWPLWPGTQLSHNQAAVGVIRGWFTSYANYYDYELAFDYYHPLCHNHNHYYHHICYYYHYDYYYGYAKQGFTSYANPGMDPYETLVWQFTLQALTSNLLSF